MHVGLTYETLLIWTLLYNYTIHTISEKEKEVLIWVPCFWTRYAVVFSSHILTWHDSITNFTVLCCPLTTFPTSPINSVCSIYHDLTLFIQGRGEFQQPAIKMVDLKHFDYFNFVIMKDFYCQVLDGWSVFQPNPPPFSV